MWSKELESIKKTNDDDYVKCADCGKIVYKKDADYSLGKNKPLCQNCFEAREYNNAWW